MKLLFLVEISLVFMILFVTHLIGEVVRAVSTEEISNFPSFLDAQIPNAHVCIYSSGTWSPSFECLERCMKNPKRKQSLGVCSFEKCFCKKPLALGPKG